MSNDTPGNRSATHGSYVQLSTYDEKEKTFKPEKSALPQVWPYKKCVCTRRDAILVTCVLGTALLIVAVSLGLGLPKVQQRREEYLHPVYKPSSTPLGTYSQGAVSADGQPCARIARGALEQGGNAVDAAIAASFCAAVVHPQGAGIGGGMLINVYSKANKTATTIEARSVAKSVADLRPTEQDNSSTADVLGEVSLPSTLRGLQEAHDRFGKLAWRSLIEPAISLCKEGFAVSPELACELQKIKNKLKDLPGLKQEIWNNSTNDVLREGEIWRRLSFADTLEKIAEKGADILYRGELSSGLIDDIEHCGGGISSSDLAGYTASIYPLLQLPLYGPLTILAPSNLDGIMLPFVLKLLNHYNMSKSSMEQDTSYAALQYHRIAEAFKIAFSESRRLEGNWSQILPGLVSGDWPLSGYKKISDDMVLDAVDSDETLTSENDVPASHVSVVTQEGDVVTLTSSLGAQMSDVCFSPSTGIFLSRSKTLSSVNPAIITQEGSDDVIAAGASIAGPKSLTVNAQALLRLLFLHDDIKQATDASRIHQKIQPDVLEYEHDFPQIYIEKLLELGHTLKQSTEPLGVFRGITNRSGNIQTNLDYRATGSVDGL